MAGWSVNLGITLSDGRRALVADGWTVVEVTWADLEHRPAEVLDQIRRTLARLGS